MWVILLIILMIALIIWNQKRIKQIDREKKEQEELILQEKKIVKKQNQAFLITKQGIERENFFLNYIDSLENNNQSAND